MNFLKKWKRFWTLNRHHDAGFTLVELIVVIAILAILAGVAVPAYNGYIRKANQAADDQLLAAVNTAFTSACMENGEYNMLDLSFTPKVKGDIQTKVEMETFDESFQRFFAGNGVFKYYEVLRFDEVNGVFVGDTAMALAEAFKAAWEASNLNKEGMVELLMNTFDGISGFFSEMTDAEELAEYLLSDVSDSLSDAMGLKGMLAGYTGAVDLKGEDLEACLEKYVDGYAEMNEAEKEAWKANNADTIETIKGNLGVMHFAQDAQNSNVADTLAGVKNFVTLMDARYEGEITQQDYIDYYKSTLTPDELAEFENQPNQWEIVQNKFVSKNGGAGGYAVSLGDLQLTADELVRMSKATTEDMKNTNTSVSTLGSMYALAAGYFNSEYYKDSEIANDSEMEGWQPNYSQFECFLVASSQTNFKDYLDNCGEADLEAYRTYMSYLAENPDVDMTKPDAFAGQSDYINGALGK